MDEKQKDNLKQLLIGCKPLEATLDQEKTSTQLELAGQLEELGFKDPANKIMDRIMYLEKLAKTSRYKYVRVMPSRIHKFLHDKVMRYNQEHSIKEPNIDIEMTAEQFEQIIEIFKKHPEYTAIKLEAGQRIKIGDGEKEIITLTATQYKTFIEATKKDDEERADNEQTHLELMLKFINDRMARVANRELLQEQANSAIAGIGARDPGIGFPSPTPTPDSFLNIDDFRKKGVAYEKPHMTISVKTKDYSKTDPKTIGQFTYTEVPVSEYTDIPPNDVLQVMKTHKDRKIFDYFSIAKVTHIVDPIMFGRINGCEDRFYICQWGSDITLDDVL